MDLLPAWDGRDTHDLGRRTFEDRLRDCVWMLAKGGRRAKKAKDQR